MTTDPPRLREAGDEVQRALIGSARGDGLAPLAGRRVAKTVVAAVASGSASSMAAAGALGAKVVALAVAGAAVGTGAWAWHVQTQKPARMAPAHVSPLAPAARTSAPPPVRTDLFAARPPGGDTSSAEPARVHRGGASSLVAQPRARRAAVPSPSPRTTTADDSTAGGAQPARLTEEIALIDRARSRLAAHDPQAALEALTLHARRHPSGLLMTEAAVLRCEALASSGRREEARAVATRLLLSESSALYANRVRALLREIDGP